MIQTTSIFYFGHTVDSTNNKVNFNEGGSELTATLNSGSYSLADYAAEVKRALDAAGALTFTVSVNRTTRILTVAASGTFALLVTTGTNVSSTAFTMMGFTANKSGSATYAGDTTSGSSFTPQFKLQDYIPGENFRKAVDATTSTTASGYVEVVRFGSQEFYEMNIRFSTDIFQPSSGPITNDASGVSKLRTLMQYLITKAPVEFMPDATVPATFETFILESTPEDSRGIGYKLKERFDLGIPGYFDTGVLRFRVVV